MQMALIEAARDPNEVPVGVVIVKDGKVIAKTHNQRERLQDSTAHAEILAIRQASKKLKSWRLLDCTMYVTLEPCAMCAGAIVNARIPRLVIGAMDYRAGCCGSIENLIHHNMFNHRVEATYGIMERECREIIQDFFKSRRGI